MKKCVQCRAQIDMMVPISVCSGGAGAISEVTADPEEAAVAQTGPDNNTGLPQGPLMNNGIRDTNNDIQKLQQQLQDIKEQVSIPNIHISSCYQPISKWTHFVKECVWNYQFNSKIYNTCNYQPILKSH